jgi:flagellar motor switch/type III secretory pathway protein FliN
LTTEGGDVLCRLLMTPALTTRLVAEPPEHQDANVPPELLDALRKVPVKVHPVITGATLRVTDLRRMKPGNVLQLEIREQDAIGLRFNGALLARGHLKRSGHDRMFEITQLTSTRTSS